MGTNGLAPNLKRWIFQIAKLLAAAVALGGIIYWLKFSPVPVSEHEVKLGDIVAEVMGTGTLEAHFKSTISPRISGRIQKVLVDMGETVTAGQLLARLDDVELKPQVEIAQASVDVSQAAIERLQSDRLQATAVLEQTTTDRERALRLQPGGAPTTSPPCCLAANNNGSQSPGRWPNSQASCWPTSPRPPWTAIAAGR